MQFVGIIQEQHPDRCKLFLQWKKMDMPVLVDSFNVLELQVVPVVLGVDGQLGIHSLPRDPGAVEAAFVKRTFDAPEPSPEPKDAVRSLLAPLPLESREPKRLGSIIERLRSATTQHRNDGRVWFALGVAYRMRYDSPLRRADDFQHAVDAWQRALDANPNQYIWRRRIQQYGPRLDKPYPFYDWVPLARREIRGRGEAPARLTVEPGGAEFAHPQKQFDAVQDAPDPDPQDRITRDTQPLIRIEHAVVPPVVRPGSAVRVHLTLRPNRAAGGHWNNEAGPLTVVVRPPEGWRADPRVVRVDVPADKPVSEEPRHGEFELRAPRTLHGDAVEVPAYALYYVCEDADGRCVYRRQDIRLRIGVRR